jgi:hypothetical protein
MVADRKLLKALFGQFYTVHEVARLGGVTVQGVHYWVKAKYLSPIRLGWGRTLFEPAEVWEFLKTRPKRRRRGTEPPTTTNES